MNSGILIISKDSNYLHDILKIEGITSDTAVDFTESIKNYNLILINNFQFDNITIKKFDLLPKKQKTFIIINPDTQIEKKLNLGLKKHEEKTKITINDYLCQIYNAKLYSPKNVVILNKSANKEPLIFETSYKESKIIIFAFDLNKTIYALNQGKDAVPDHGGVYRASSTSIIERGENLFPQSDILRRHIVKIIEHNLNFPLPKIWYIPNKKLSGAIFSHDSDEAGDKDIKQINELNKKNKIRGTTFMLIKTGTKECWQEFKKNNIDLQLHQAYFYIPNTPKKFKSLSAWLISNPISLKFQEFLLYAEKSILSLSAKAKITGVRNHGLFWHKKTSTPLWMHRAKIKFDSTLGGVFDYGYLHGTGLPYFLRLPKNYSSFDVLEFPLHIMDYMSFKFKNNYQELAKKFILNAKKFNSIITLDFHHKFLITEKISKWYIEIISQLKSEDFFIQDMAYYSDFWRKRIATEITELNFEKNKLAYRLSSKYQTSGLTQILPLRFQDKKLNSVKSGGKKLKFEKVKISGKFYALFEFSELNKEIVAEFSEL